MERINQDKMNCYPMSISIDMASPGKSGGALGKCGEDITTDIVIGTAMRMLLRKVFIGVTGMCTGIWDNAALPACHLSAQSLF